MQMRTVIGRVDDAIADPAYCPVDPDGALPRYGSWTWRRHDMHKHAQHLASCCVVCQAGPPGPNALSQAPPSHHWALGEMRGAQSATQVPVRGSHNDLGDSVPTGDRHRVMRVMLTASSVVVRWCEGVVSVVLVVLVVRRAGSSHGTGLVALCEAVDLLKRRIHYYPSF